MLAPEFGEEPRDEILRGADDADRAVDAGKRRGRRSGERVAVVAPGVDHDQRVGDGLERAHGGVQHGAVGVLDHHSVFDHGGNPWLWALVHAGFVLAESAVLVIFWYASEQTRRVEEDLRAELSEGKSSVRARLEETDRIRADLIATVSHEFRTPLTGIRGAALTLLKRGDRLDEQSRQRLLAAVLDQQERLSRLLENMLTAARATAADPTAMAEVDGVAAEVAMLAGANRPESPPVSVVVEAGTVARIDRHALHQVLANLVDNAQQHGRPRVSTLASTY